MGPRVVVTVLTAAATRSAYTLFYGCLNKQKACGFGSGQGFAFAIAIDCDFEKRLSGFEPEDLSEITDLSSFRLLSSLKNFASPCLCCLCFTLLLLLLSALAVVDVLYYFFLFFKVLLGVTN